jgi:two-component system, LytTR family, response regulator
VRVLIVDDEPLARQGVSLRLKATADIEIVGECGDGPSAVKTILELAPDLVFLDVQMPGMDGFEVLRTLPTENLPAVIFVTAHDQHALRAFSIHALDYLLKPVDDLRFAAAVDRAAKMMNATARAQMAERILQMLNKDLGKYPSRILVRTGQRTQIVLVEDIEWISAAGEHTELHVLGRSHLLRETMSSLQGRLDPTAFLRIHRSRIVRTKCIVELRSIDNREHVITLSDGSEHRSSRTYAPGLEQWLVSGRSGR